MTLLRALLLSLMLAVGAPLVTLSVTGLYQGLDVASGLITFWRIGVMRSAGVGTGEARADQSDLEVQRRTVRWLGDIDSLGLDEASGLTSSRREKHVLFAMNDSGSEAGLFALDHAGRHLAYWRVDHDGRHDFESLAGFSHGGEDYLLIADTGDNLNWRSHVNLLVVKEPLVSGGGGEIGVEWIQRIGYPGGKRDVEAVAVNSDDGEILLISKARIPPELFSVPLLVPGSEEVVTATLVTRLRGIPAPNARHLLEDGLKGRYRSQVTGFDIKGRQAVLLTYGDAYLYRRRGDESWAETFLKLPARIPLPKNPRMEAGCIDREDGFIVTAERLGHSRAAIFRVQM